MKSFTKQELKSLFIIFIILFGVISVNMSISLRRGRDSIRKNDISAIQKAVDTYYQKYRTYPLSDNGQIVGCFSEEVRFDKLTDLPTNVETCKWGESTFEDIRTMPRDPRYKDGSSYLYVSDGDSYMFYISLEGKDEAEYTESIVSMNLQCGNKICNYGRGQ